MPRTRHFYQILPPARFFRYWRRRSYAGAASCLAQRLMGISMWYIPPPETISELSALCSSKYVQSRIPADCYLQVKKAPADGRWVYFSGVPCQIAALKSYLGRENATLITQDTACHSVPSPMVWNDYAEALEKQHDGNLTGFSFRNKANGWEGYYICAEFDNSKEFRQPAAENPYQRGFIKGLYSRNSCFSCKFKGSSVAAISRWPIIGVSKAFRRRLTTRRGHR